MENSHYLTDSFNRRIDYLRISLTDRCNLRCRYCLPAAGGKLVSHEEVLRYEELIELAGMFYRLGVKKWRLTGGEPLIKNNLGFLVKGLKALGDDVRLALTTNGVLLASQLEELIESGISRFNVSCDTLKPERFHYLTRGGELAPVLEGIDLASNSSIDPLRLNVIIFKNYNEDEIIDFARLAIERPIWVRFIEYMPLGEKGFYSHFGGVSGEFIRKKISSVLPLVPAVTKEKGPATYYRVDKGAGMVGFINPLSHSFCGSCNRLRLSSTGSLRPCLFSEAMFDLKTPLRTGNIEEVANLINQAVSSKPASYTLPGIKEQQQPMSSIGG